MPAEYSPPGRPHDGAGRRLVSRLAGAFLAAGTWKALPTAMPLAWGAAQCPPTAGRLAIIVMQGA